MPRKHWHVAPARETQLRECLYAVFCFVSVLPWGSPPSPISTRALYLVKHRIAISFSPHSRSCNTRERMENPHALSRWVQGSSPPGSAIDGYGLAGRKCSDGRNLSFLCQAPTCPPISPFSYSRPYVSYHISCRMHMHNSPPQTMQHPPYL